MRDVAFHKSEVGVVCYFIEVRADEAGSAGEEDFHNFQSAKSREFPSSQAPREVLPRMFNKERILIPMHVRCRNPRGRNDRSGLIRLAH